MSGINALACALVALNCASVQAPAHSLGLPEWAWFLVAIGWLWNAIRNLVWDK